MNCNTQTTNEPNRYGMFLSATFMGLPVYSKLPPRNDYQAEITNTETTRVEKEMS